MIRKRIIDPLIGFLKQGISPRSLALAITAGIVISYIPIFGISTLLCLLAIWLMRLNPAVVLLANNVAYPLQFIFYIPFLRAGEWLFNAPKTPFSITEIVEMARQNLWHLIMTLWQSTMYGMVVWVIVSIPVAVVLFYVLKTAITRFSGSQPSQTSSHQ